jgi:hypothetical protein
VAAGLHNEHDVGKYCILQKGGGGRDNDIDCQSSGGFVGTFGEK